MCNLIFFIFLYFRFINIDCWLKHTKKFNGIIEIIELLIKLYFLMRLTLLYKLIFFYSLKI
ncbi:hypothetical protein NUSPORA_01072 [Nucleospora cyclopteri]